MTNRTPTPEQQAIFDAALQSDANLFVEALAGTGKTTTLEMLLGRMPQQSTLAVAFNVKNKEEFQRRFPEHVTCLTLNGLGLRAWKSACGKPVKTDGKKLGGLVTKALARSAQRADSDTFSALMRLISLAMQQGLIPTKFQTNYKSLVPDTMKTWQDINSLNFLDLNDEAIMLAHDILEESIRESFAGIVSFDDQIYMSAMFNGHFPRFPLVIVDEAQDLSPLNHIQVKRASAQRLIVVGDTRQAIYQFRGADGASMAKLRGLRPEDSWTTLHLSTTFRCPSLVVERQLEHAPLYRAAPSNPQGAIVHFDEWSGAALLEQAPNGASIAVLCRNNAPLLSLAFKLIRQGIGINMLGRDIGKSLTAMAKKILGKRAESGEAIAADECSRRIREWQQTETSKAIANGQDEKIAGIDDRAECLLAVLEGHNGGCKDSFDLFEGIESIFAQSGRVTLSTGHRAKGMEWDFVLHLDPWRIPSRYALSNPVQMEQEKNLRYVIETRTKHTLALASMNKFLEG